MQRVVQLVNGRKGEPLVSAGSEQKRDGAPPTQVGGSLSHDLNMSTSLCDYEIESSE